jgi:hypothetical protein
MVIDVHQLYPDPPACPLGPWAALLGYPEWLCRVAARVHMHRSCALLECGDAYGCPLRSPHRDLGKRSGATKCPLAEKVEDVSR